MVATPCCDRGLYFDWSFRARNYRAENSRKNHSRVCRPIAVAPSVAPTLPTPGRDYNMQPSISEGTGQTQLTNDAYKRYFPEYNMQLSIYKVPVKRGLGIDVIILLIQERLTIGSQEEEGGWSFSRLVLIPGL